MPIAHRPRSVFRLSGEGVRTWLDSLLTNSLREPVTFAALLTPQGKIISDFFVTDREDHLLIDTPVAMGEALFKRLKMYRLRAPIAIDEVSDTYSVNTLWGDDATRGHVDPRLDRLGTRLITDQALRTTGDYDTHRLSLGVPDSEWDFQSMSVFPMDACMDELGGLDYKKGCFVGQEVVSRMKRKSEVRKRMRGLHLTGPAAPGDKITAEERTVGQILHVNGMAAMAMLRVDHIRRIKSPLSLNGHPVQLLPPAVAIDD